MKFFLIILILLNFLTTAPKANEVNVFSSRHYSSDIQLYEKFTSISGIKVNVVSGNDAALQKRIVEEGSDSKADLYITADAGRLGLFDQKGMFQNSISPKIKSIVPKSLRSDNWTGIAKRARIIFYSKDRIDKEVIKNLRYEDFSDPKWNNKITVRQSNNIYNQSWIASIISNNGKENTDEWVKKFVKNFARDPKGNDRAQILAVAAGEADIAIANTYYYALMLSGQKGLEQQQAAKKVVPYFPNQSDRGTHMNISGGGILKYAPNPENALKLLEFLLTEEAQSHIVKNTFEYPIIENVEPSEIIKSMGSFKQDLSTPVEDYARFQAVALELMLRAGWK